MMISQRTIYFLLLALVSFSACKAQKTAETLSDDFDKSPPFFYNIPEKLSATDTSAGWEEAGQKILLTGIVYEQDGITPAKDVLLYYYHTNAAGKYATDDTKARNMPANKLGQTHGYLRGWVKTGENGNYKIYTTMPGTYPSRDEPAHVHLSVQEPDAKEIYYIDDFVFDNDILLNSARRQSLENRGGSGIIRFVQDGDLMIGERDIFLGLNIPGAAAKSSNSGNEIGEEVFSFTPYHAFGPDKGTKTCPICKYGWYNGVLFFSNKNLIDDDLKNWIKYLEKESVKRAEYLKVYFVFANENKAQQERVLEAVGKELQLKNVALTIVPSFMDADSEINLNNISAAFDNTIIIYKRSKIIGKYVALLPTESNFKVISAALDISRNAYFNYPSINAKD